MKFGKDVENLLKKLLIHYDKYFHKEVLNSDGRRLFMEILRMLMYEHPELRRTIYRVRRKLDLYSVKKIAYIVLGEETTEELLKEAIYGKYLEYLY